MAEALQRKTQHIYIFHQKIMELSLLIGAGSATIALAGAAVGIGNVFSSLINSVAAILYISVSSKKISGLMPARALILGVCMGQVFLSLILAKIAVSLGYVLMEDLSRAVAQFYPSTSGGMSGVPSSPPGPSGDPSLLGIHIDSNTEKEAAGPAEISGPLPIDGENQLHVPDREVPVVDPDPEVDRIMDSCWIERERMIFKIKSIFLRREIALEDTQDIVRAVDIVLTDHWQIGPLEGRVAYFRSLRNGLGKRGSPFWQDILSELKDLGNQNMPDE